MNRVQNLIEEIRAVLGVEGRPCAPVECLRQVYELESYLPTLAEQERKTVSQTVMRVRVMLEQMPPASREACLVHALMSELRHYALLVLQLEHLRTREIADLLHARDALHFALAYQRELAADVAAEEGLISKWDARLRTSYHPRFAAVLEHYRQLMPLDEARWWWYLDQQVTTSRNDDTA